MPKKIDRTGECFKNRIDLGNCEFIIIKYIRNNDIVVEFQDEYKAKVHTTYQNCLKGEVKNPYYKNIFNVACIGLMPDGSKPITKINNRNTREYMLWYSMLQRCYDSEYWIQFPTYKDANVCDRWLIFANFLEDIKLIEGYDFWLNHPNEGISLDKDIKGNNSKIYSLDTCCFVTASDNSKERNERCGIAKAMKSKVKIYGINIKTGERTKDFESITEATKEIGAKGIARCVRGERRSCGGYYWFKIKEDD